MPKIVNGEQWRTEGDAKGAPAWGFQGGHVPFGHIFMNFYLKVAKFCAPLLRTSCLRDMALFDFK